MKGSQKHVDKGVVYQIPCAQCDKVYIGETGRPLKTRITTHKRALSTGDVKNTNAVHCMKINHSMDWNAATIVDKYTSGRERPTTWTWDSSLSPVWNSLIRPVEDY